MVSFSKHRRLVRASNPDRHRQVTTCRCVSVCDNRFTSERWHIGPEHGILKRTHDYNLPTSYSRTSACSSLHRHLSGFFRSSRTLRILLMLRPESPDGSVPNSLSVASAFSRVRFRGPTSRELRQRPVRDYRIVSYHLLQLHWCTVQHPPLHDGRRSKGRGTGSRSRSRYDAST